MILNALAFIMHLDVLAMLTKGGVKISTFCSLELLISPAAHAEQQNKNQVLSIFQHVSMSHAKLYGDLMARK